MWVLITHAFARLLGVILPWLPRYVFSSLVKKASKGALKKAPLRFQTPNFLVSIIAVCGINGLNFVVMLFLTDSKMLWLISAGSVTVVTAFFLLRGFFCSHTMKERATLLSALVLFFGLFVVCLFVWDIVWLALVAKLTLEVILCFAVMLVELRKLNRTQSRVVEAIMKKLRISPDKPVGKGILKFFGSKRAPAEPTANNLEMVGGDAEG